MDLPYITTYSPVLNIRLVYFIINASSSVPDNFLQFLLQLLMTIDKIDNLRIITTSTKLLQFSKYFPEFLCFTEITPQIICRCINGICYRDQIYQKAII